MQLIPENIGHKYVLWQISGKQRLTVYRKIMKFLRNGVSLPNALDTMWTFESLEGKKPNRPMALMLDDWRKKVRNGTPFGIAVKKWVPEQDAVVISSGESAGRLDIALDNAIYIREGGKKIQAAIAEGLAYPALLLSVLVAFLYLVAIKIVPAFDDVHPKELWTGSGRSLAVVAEFMNSYLVPSIIGLVVLVLGIIISLPRWSERGRVFADKMPPYSMYRLSVGAGFLLSMAAMVRAGVSLTRAMQIMQRTASPYLDARLSATAYQIEDEGLNFGEALHATGYQFPDKEAVSDLRAYALLDGFDETLTTLGTEWMEDSIVKIKEQSALMRNASMVVLGVVFGWISSGIFSLQQQVTQALQ